MTPPDRAVLLAHPSADLYGSDRVMLETVSALVEDGRRVVVTVPAHGPLVDLIEERGAEVSLCETVVLRKSMLSLRGIVSLVPQVIGFVRRGHRLITVTRPAVVVVNTLTIPMWSLLARLHRVPVVCHVHEAEGSAAGWKRALLNLPLLLANRVVANSRYSVSVIARSLPSLARRVEVVYNGVAGPARPEPVRSTLTSPVVLLYIGRLSPRKGVDVAVDAVADLVRRGIPARLDVVGAVYPGYEWYQDELRAQVDRLGLSGHVIFHGFRPQVWGPLAEADIVLVPSRADEPFGNTAVEAVLAGRPVIASATSGLLEATDGYGSARTVAPGRSQAVADAVESMVHDWESVATAAWESIDKAVERHRPATYRRAMADVVRRLR